MSDEDGYEKPSDLLNEFTGDTVKVVRHDGSVIIGTLHAFDNHINLVLTNATVYPEGTDAQKQDDVGRFFQHGGSVTDVRSEEDDSGEDAKETDKDKSGTTYT